MLGFPVGRLGASNKHASNPLKLDLNLALDPGSSLDSRITFSSPARTYLNAGVLTSISANQPTFESWDGVNRGLALEPAFTNLVPYSNDPTHATLITEVTIASGDVGPGLITQLNQISATVNSSFHKFSWKPGSQAAGLTQTHSAYFKAVAGATSYSCWLQVSAEFNNGGAVYHFRIDGNEGFYFDNDNANATTVTYGWKKLSGGIYQVWITATWLATGNKQFMIGVSAKTAPEARNYAGATTQAVQVFGAQIATANGPTSYVATSGATASIAATTAAFNDTSWLTTSQGTFVVEHDCSSGPVIGSGANTIISSAGVSPYGTTKVALAWSGSTSDLVTNGGSSTAGGLPTFSGTDIRLLATSGANSAGHIKRIRFYNTRLTVQQMQALTSPSMASTAQPGILRTASVDNHVPTSLNTTSGTALTFLSRFRLKLGGTGYDCSSLQLDFPNFQGIVGATGNALNITGCYLERVTGVSESVQVKVGGSGTFTVADGASGTVLSDAILPSAFTNLSTFPANMEFYVRVQGTVASAGMKIPGARQAETYTSTTGFGRIYDPAAVSFSAVSGTGAISKLSGTDPGQLTVSYCPVLVGNFVTGDPVTNFHLGDSIIEGTQNLGQTGTFLTLCALNLGIPRIEMARGGSSQLEAENSNSYWNPYLKYCRVLWDEMGTNNQNATLSHASYWNYFRKTALGDKIVRIGLFPKASSTDSFATEANQTIVRPYPTAYPDRINLAWLAYGPSQGGTDYNIDPQSIRGTNKGKWWTDGTAFYGTPDGTHPSTNSTTALQSEVQPLMAAVTVT